MKLDRIINLIRITFI